MTEKIVNTEEKIIPISPEEITIGEVHVEKRTLFYDARGYLEETYDKEKEIKPSVYSYGSLTRPGQARDEDKYHFHLLQEDRFTVFQGTFWIILFDQRAGSPTFGHLEILKLQGGDPEKELEPDEKMQIPTFTVTIPKGVYHGIRNPGPGYAIIINHPTERYNPEDEGRASFSEFPIESLNGKTFSWNKVQDE